MNKVVDLVYILQMVDRNIFNIIQEDIMGNYPILKSHQGQMVL